MSRSLNRTVVVGGDIYPAGTAATEELEGVITNPDYWSGDDTAPKARKSAKRKSAKRKSAKSKDE